VEEKGSRGGGIPKNGDPPKEVFFSPKRKRVFWGAQKTESPSKEVGGGERENLKPPQFLGIKKPPPPLPKKRGAQPPPLFSKNLSHPPNIILLKRNLTPFWKKLFSIPHPPGEKTLLSRRKVEDPPLSKKNMWAGGLGGGGCFSTHQQKKNSPPLSLHV